MVVFTFFVLDKDDKERFFKNSFLLTDVKPKIVLGILFPTMSNTDIDFQTRNLQWRSYIIGDVFPTTWEVELIGKKEFAATAFDPKHEAFVAYIAVFYVDLNNEMYLLRRAKIAYLKADKAFSKVLSKYADFANVFFSKLAAKLPEHTRINDYAIKLVND